MIGQENEIIHKKVFSQKKEWLSGPWEKSSKKRAIVEDDCPVEGCDSKKVYFSTA